MKVELDNLLKEIEEVAQDPSEDSHSIIPLLLDLYRMSIPDEEKPKVTNRLETAMNICKGEKRNSIDMAIWGLGDRS